MLQPAFRRQTGEAKDEANQALIVERAEQQSAVLGCGDQHVQRDDLDVGQVPHLALQLLDGADLAMGGKGMDGEDRRSHT